MISSRGRLQHANALVSDFSGKNNSRNTCPGISLQRDPQAKPAST
jgi:hypothetical protein